MCSATTCSNLSATGCSNKPCFFNIKRTKIRDNTFYEELLRGSSFFSAGACQGYELFSASQAERGLYGGLTEQRASRPTESRSRTNAARASLLSLLLTGNWLFFLL